MQEPRPAPGSPAWRGEGWPEVNKHTEFGAQGSLPVLQFEGLVINLCFDPTLGSSAILVCKT